MFCGEEGRKTLEEEILDGCGHGIHGNVQAVQVHILIRKIRLATVHYQCIELKQFETNLFLVFSFKANCDNRNFVQYTIEKFTYRIPYVL